MGLEDQASGSTALGRGSRRSQAISAGSWALRGGRNRRWRGAGGRRGGHWAPLPTPVPLSSAANSLSPTTPGGLLISTPIVEGGSVEHSRCVSERVCVCV